MYKPLGIVMRAYGGCYRELMGWKRYFKPPGERASDQVSPTNTHWRLGEKRNCPTSSHHPHVEQENHSSCFKKQQHPFLLWGNIKSHAAQNAAHILQFLMSNLSSFCAAGLLSMCTDRWTNEHLRGQMDETMSR